jgi:glutathione S-transferase
MLTLYDYTPAPSPRRARIFLAEKGIEYENVQIDLQTGKQFSPEYLAITPRCAVPALKTDTGEVITENVAIASYIENLHPEPALMGRTAFEKAKVLEWNWRIEFEGLYAIADILRNTSKAMKDRAMTGPRNVEQLPELAERGRLRLGHFFEDLNTQLSDFENVAGDTYSLADITALVAVDFSSWVKESPDEGLTALHEWHAKVSKRPSSQA